MKNVAHALRRMVFAGLALGPAAATAGQELPCGVTDPGGRTGFVANAHGGIDAVDLATGDLLWDVEGAKRPALAEDDRLFAWAPEKDDGLRVLAFERAPHGRRLLESDPASFPDWVNVAEGPGRSFATRWRLEKNRLILDWEARAWYSGPHPTPQAEADARKSAEGRVRFDLETGKAESAPADQAPAPAPLPKALEKAVVRWQGAAGGARAALVLEEEGGRQKLSLWSWDADGVRGPKELMTGRRLLALATIDDCYLCVRDAAAAPDQGPGEPNGWSIFAADGGERLARVAFQPGTEAVAVVGPRAYCLVAGPFKGPIDRPFVRPRGLKALDLRSGKLLWEHPTEGKLCLPPAP